LHNRLYINTLLIPTSGEGAFNVHLVNEVVVGLRPVSYHDVNVVVSDNYISVDIKEILRRRRLRRRSSPAEPTTASFRLPSQNN